VPIVALYIQDIVVYYGRNDRTGDIEIVKNICVA